VFGLREKKVQEIEPVIGPFIGCLGKVSVEADFVSKNSNSREVRVIDEAMRSFYSEVGTGDSSQALQSVGFCLVGGGDRQSLTGYLYPSSDKVGRLYPFSAFLQLPDPEYYFRADWTLDSSVNALQENLLDQMHSSDSVDKAWEGIQKHEFLNVHVSSARDIAKLSLSIGASADAAQWLSAVFGSEQINWVNGLACICKLIVKLRQNTLPSNMDGFWLPLGGMADNRFSLMFWTQLCWSLFPPNTWRPDLLWIQDDEAGKLFILTRSITGRSLAQVSMRQDKRASFLGWQELSDSLDPIEDANYLKPINKLFSNPKMSLLDLAIELRKLL